MFNTSDLGLWILVAAFLISVLSSAVNIWSSVRRRPPIDAEFATKRELAEVEAKCNARFARMEDLIHNNMAEMRTMLTEHDSEGSSRARAIHERIDSILTMVSEVRGELNRIGGRQ